MLDDNEFEFYSAAHRKGVEAIKTYRAETGATLKDVPLERLVRPALTVYEKYTGYKAESGQFHHLWHHVVSNYGSPCKLCGKNLRTPKAKYCVECGENV